MAYHFRSAAEADIPAVAKIFDAARAFLKEQGIEQWQGAMHPSVETERTDISVQTAYVLEDDSSHIVAAVSIVPGEDPFYSKLEGAWLSDGPYATIHRVAVSKDVRGQGISKILLLRCITRARELGVRSVRIDTHPDNKIMQAAIRGAGFTECGRLRVYDNTTRLGYELVFKDIDSPPSVDL